jgi:hypothetical protein
MHRPMISLSDIWVNGWRSIHSPVQRILVVSQYYTVFAPSGKALVLPRLIVLHRHHSA